MTRLRECRRRASPSTISTSSSVRRQGANLGAEGEVRTRTGLPPAVFNTAASAASATSARSCSGRGHRSGREPRPGAARSTIVTSPPAPRTAAGHASASGRARHADRLGAVQNWGAERLDGAAYLALTRVACFNPNVPRIPASTTGRRTTNWLLSRGASLVTAWEAATPAAKASGVTLCILVLNAAVIPAVRALRRMSVP